MNFKGRKPVTSGSKAEAIVVTIALSLLLIGLFLPGAANAQLGLNGGQVLMKRGTSATRALQGLCFSPYLKVNPANGDVLTPAQIGALMDKIAPVTGGLRTFCSTGIWSGMPKMARSRGMFVAAGCDIYKSRAYNNTEVNGLVKLARGGNIDLAVVGDETQETNAVSEAQLISYIKKVKATGVPTTTSETWNQLLDHQKIMAQCDVVIMNVYPFWESVGVQDSVSYIDSCYRRVKQAAGGKEVIVETGWPSAGDANGAALPGMKNSCTYLQGFMSWARSNNVRYFYFEAFDELWKASREGSVGAHWGIWDQNGKLKPGMDTVLGMVK